MADLIKKIKIKKQDGTFTDYIPIGANAANVETSDGESVQLKLNKKPYYYTNVASMKADTKLKAGDMAITLGYYEANDGGGAEYQIVNDNTLVDDGGSVHELNNGLKANIVAINNEINVKQFGAKGDNITDDTQSFIKACAYLQREGTIYVPKGHYKITDTITIPDILSIHGKDGCPVLEHYGNNDLISLQGHTKTSEHNIAGTTNKCEIKPILKQLILRENNNNSISTGIKINTTSDTWFARSSFDNIQVHGFNIGFKLGRYNCYILHFNRCNFVRNNIAFETPDEKPSNSGERISFTDCVIDSNAKGFNFITEGFDLFFSDCSIDYNICLFYSMTGAGRRFIDINHCHYETNRTADNDTPHGILWGWMSQTVINITNSIIFTRITEQQFTNPGVTVSWKMELNLINNYILYWEADYNNFTGIKNLYFVPTKTSLVVKSKQNHFGYVGMGKPIALINNILGDAGFSKLNTGDAIINTNSYIADSSGNISNFLIDSGYQTNISKYEVKDINDFTGTKSLALVPSDNTQSISSIIATEKMPMYRQLYQHFVVKNINKIEYRINYFTSENKWLTSSAWSATNISNPEVDTLLVVPRLVEYYHSKDMLQKAGYFSISFRFTNVGLEGYIPEIMSINLFED